MKANRCLLEQIKANQVAEITVSDQAAALLKEIKFNDGQRYNTLLPLKGNAVLGLECADKEIRWGILDLESNQGRKGSIPTGYSHNYITTAPLTLTDKDLATLSLKDKDRLVIGDSQGYISIVNLATMQIETKHKAHASQVENIQIGRNNKIMSTSHTLANSSFRTRMHHCYYQPTSKTLNPHNYGRILNGALNLDAGYLHFSEDKHHPDWIYAISYHTSAYTLTKYLTDRNEPKLDQIIASGYESILCHYKMQNRGEYMICKKRNGDLVILGDGTYVYNAQFESREIAFEKGEHIYFAKMLSDDYLLVQSDKLVHIIEFKTRNTIAKFALPKHCLKAPLEALQTEFGFAIRHPDYYTRSTLQFYALPELRDLNALFKTLEHNNSVKHFTLKDKHLNLESIDYLYALTCTRTDIQYEFSPAIEQQLASKRLQAELLRDKQLLEKTLLENKGLLNEKYQELEALKKESEQVLQVQIAKQQSEIEHKQIEMEALRAEITSQKENNAEQTLRISALLEEKKFLIQTSEQAQQELDQALSLLEKSTQPSSSVRKQIAARLPLEAFYGQLLESEENIKHLNLIAHASNQHILAIQETLIAKGAILDVKTLYQKITEASPRVSPQLELKHLTLAIEQLLHDFEHNRLPETAIQQAHALLLDSIKIQVNAREETRELLALEITIQKNKAVKGFLTNAGENPALFEIFVNAVNFLAEKEQYQRYAPYFLLNKSTLLEQMRNPGQDKKQALLAKAIKQKMQKNYSTPSDLENQVLMTLLSDPLSECQSELQAIFAEAFKAFWLEAKDKLNPMRLKIDALKQRISELEEAPGRTPGSFFIH